MERSLSYVNSRLHETYWSVPFDRRQTTCDKLPSDLYFEALFSLPGNFSRSFQELEMLRITRLLFAAILLTGMLVPTDTANGQDSALAEFPKLSAENDWPWWRGPTRNGIASDRPVPTKFSETEGVLWKSPVPGRGHSSPIVVGNRVFLTTADEPNQTHSILAFDRASGKLLWQTEVSRGGFPAHNHAKNTEATPTVASDGERLYATFFHHKKIEAYALDFDGKMVWKKDIGPFNPQRYEYGYAPSPLLYKSSIIIAAEYDGSSFIAAHRRDDGTRLWKTPRPESISFSTPVVSQVNGKDQLLISGSEKIVSYDPSTGKQLWSTPGTTFATCGTMVWDGDMVFASGGYPKAETVGIKVDTRGKLIWKNNQKCYEQSMLAYQGYVYALTDNGIMICWRGSDGREMWKERLTGPVSASPVLAGGHYYWANELGTLYVVRPNPERFELVAENHIGTESFASPAICGGQIFLRVATKNGIQRQETLYCFQK